MSQPVLKLRDSHSSRSESDFTIRKPQKLGSYSVKNTPEGREYAEGEGELRILKLPPKLKHLTFDLSDGYIRMRDGGSLLGSHSEEPGLKNLLKWVASNKEKFQLHSGVASSSALNTDFLTYRGVLTKIMSSPYEKREGWCIGATKYKGTIYLYEFMTEKKRQDELNRDEKSNMFSYGGFRFEYYVTEPADLEANDEKLDFQQKKHNEYCCVARSRLRHHSLVYGAEMDCIEKRNQVADPVLSDFMEIKTTRMVDNQRQWDNLVRYKMFKWWAQCYLIGIPTLVCGYRDDNLMVREIEVFKVSDMPAMASKFWTPKVCLRFLDRFLDFVKQVVTEEDANSMYEFSWEPNSDVNVRKTAVTADRFVIPKWFVDSL